MEPSGPFSALLLGYAFLNFIACDLCLHLEAILNDFCPGNTQANRDNANDRLNEHFRDVKARWKIHTDAHKRASEDLTKERAIQSDGMSYVFVSEPYSLTLMPRSTSFPYVPGERYESSEHISCEPYGTVLDNHQMIALVRCEPLVENSNFIVSNMWYIHVEPSAHSPTHHMDYGQQVHPALQSRHCFRLPHCVRFEGIR